MPRSAMARRTNGRTTTDVPFQPLRKPLAECRVALVTTAAPYQPDKGDQGPGAPYNSAAKFYAVYSLDAAKDHDLRISHIAIDRAHTTAEDPGSYFPLPALRDAAARGRIGSVAAALPWPADQPQPARHHRDRLPGAGRALPGRWRRCALCSFPTARSVTRASASPPARWRRAASPPW